MKRLIILSIFCAAISAQAEITTEIVPGKYKGRLLNQKVQGSQFEFWNRSDNMLFVKIGTFQEDTEYILVEPEARLVSSDRIIRFAYALKEDPQYVHEVDYFILNPDKTGYVAFKDNKLMPQSGGIFKKTASGLSTAFNVLFNDLIWLPYPELPYKLRETPELIVRVRESKGNIKTIQDFIELQTLFYEQERDVLLQIINQQGLRGWTALHEAAFQGYNQILDYLIEKGGDENIKDNQARTPNDVKNMSNLSYVLAAFYSPAISALINYFDSYIAKLERYIQKIKRNKFVKLPTYSQQKVDELFARAREEYILRNEKIQYELKFDVLEKQGEKYLRRFKDLTTVSASFEYPDLESFINQINEALSFNDPNTGKTMQLINYDKLYEYINVTEEEQKAITVDEIRKKWQAKNEMLGFPVTGPAFVTLREVSHVLTGGYKELYDALLKGSDYYNKVREYYNKRIRTEKLVEKIQKIIEFSEIMLRIAA